jgi:hypothetical protein
MRNHALICKFVGIWLTKKFLHHWIVIKWKPKSHYEVKLVFKGFFNVILSMEKDLFPMMEVGSYFFNSAGLYMRQWVEHFNPDKEHFSWASTWIHLYSIPQNY